MRFADLDPGAVAEADELAELTSLGGGESRSAPYTGTKALMLAILEDGIRAYLSASTRAREEAELWIRSPKRHFVFSFPIVCETLGLEPDAVRMALARWRSDGVSAAAKRPARTRQAVETVRRSLRQRPDRRRARTLAG